MITWLKAQLALVFAGLFAPALYAGVFLTFIAAVFRRAEWALYLLVILTPLPTVWHKLLTFPLGNSTLDILILGAFLGILFNKKGFQSAPHTWLLTGFTVVSYCAVWNVTMRFGLPAPFSLANPVLADWKNYAEMIFLYFLAYNAIRDEDQQKTIVVIMAMVVFLIVVREFRNFSEGSAFSYDRRAIGPFWEIGLGANHLGAFVVYYGGLLFGMFLGDKHKYRKWLYLGAAVFSTWTLFFTYSRGAYAAALALVTVYGLVKKRSLLVFIAALVFTWQMILPATVVERVTMTESDTGQIEDSAAMRLVLWEHALALFQDNGIFGIGFNGFGYTVPQGSLTDTHNFYLKTAAEQGVIGLVALAAVLLGALSSGWRLLRSGQSDFHRALGLGFFGCTVAVIVSNVFGDRWSYFMLGGYFWVFWGLVDRARQLAQSRQPSTVPDSATPLRSVAGS